MEPSAPAVRQSRVASPTTYGLMSRPWPCVTSAAFSPVSRPALLILRSPWLRAHPIHRLSSFFRRTVPRKLIPQGSLVGLKFSVRNGLSLSIVQPTSPLCPPAFQMPSHCRLLLSADPCSASAIRPDGFISKKYAVRPSRNVSIVHMKRSSEPSPLSRPR